MTAYHDMTNLRLEVEATPTGLVNLVKNPSGEKGAWGWVTPVTNTTISAAPSALQFVTSVSQAAYFTTEFLPVAAGKYVAARFDLKALSPSHNVKVRYEWYDTNKTLLSSGTQTGAFTTYTTQYVPAALAPASTAYVKLRMDFYNGTGNPGVMAYVYFNNAMVTWSNTNAFSTTRTNLITNPSFEANTTGWTPNVGSSLTRVTTPAPQVGTYCVEAKASASGGISVSTPICTITGGRDYVASIYIKPATVARSNYFNFAWYDASANLISTSVGVFAESVLGTWTRFSLSRTAPSNAAFASLSITPQGATANEKHYLDAAMIEAGTTVGTYFDGSTTSGGTKSYAWTGTAHASTSTESNTSFAYSDPITWQNILGPTHSIDIERNALDVGTLSATILDAMLDPAVSSQLAPGKAIRLRANLASTWENVYEGRIDNARVSYDRDEKVVTTLAIKTSIFVTATDNIAVLANQGESRGVATIPELPYILEDKGVPWNVNGSGNQVASAAVVSQNDNASVLDQVALTRDSVSGYAWVDRYNILQAWDAVSLGATVACNFTDVINAGDTYDYYSRIDAGFNTDDVINQVIINWLRTNAETGESETVVYGPYSDATSVKAYGARQATFTIHGAIESSSDIATFANSVLAANKTPVRKAHSLTMPVRDARSLTHATQLDLYSYVNVHFSSLISSNYRITSIKHSITTDAWNVDYGFGVDGQVASPAMQPSPISSEITDGTWRVPSLGAGWVNFGAGWQDVAFMRKNGIVYLKGLMKNGTVGQTPFFLPPGYKPAANLLVTVMNDNTARRMQIRTDGAVYLDAGGTNGYWSLDGVSFVAEA